MRGIKGKNTKPEHRIRKLLHRAGYRYRLHAKELPGRPDLVFRQRRALIFVHGCFWHGHDDCHLFRLPKSRTDFWADKIGANIERDMLQLAKLHDTRWRTAIVWECALRGRHRIEDAEILDRLSLFLDDPERIAIEIRGA